MLNFSVYNLALTGLFAQEAKKTSFKDVLHSLIQQPAKIYKEHLIFSLINPNPIDDEWIAFKFLKAYPKHEEIFDDQKDEIVDTTLPKAALYLWILFNITYHIVLVEDKNDIPTSTVIKHLIPILSTGYKSFRLAPIIELNPILTNREFIQALKRFKNITTVKATIIKPNPKYGDTWKPLKDELDDENIERLDIRAQSRNIRITSDGLLNKTLHMVEDGYGEAIIHGSGIDDHAKRLRSKDIKRETVSLTSDKPEDWQRELMEFMDEVKERFTKDK
ncbi:MAG: hypothetical protein ABSE08_10070 [Syntrophobacteraceae bacterium]|jgi:hypothetical protein